MRKIQYIAIHCSAGWSLIPAIENFWYRPKSKGGLGWKGPATTTSSANPGYSIIIYPDGTKWYVTKNGTYSTDVSKFDINKITNGVLGFNPETLSISYIGGVLKDNTSKAADTRTPEQKKSIIEAIQLVQELLKKYGQDISKVKIQGHRDFSPDKNGNGVIDSWERIKECPSFDAIPEYKNLIPQSSIKTMYTLADLNIRKDAGTQFEKIGTPIPKGDSVHFIETKGEWSKVIVLKDARVGYVSSKYLR